jgi:hypothetical protein
VVGDQNAQRANDGRLIIDERERRALGRKLVVMATKDVATEA